ncbi:mucin-4 [Hyperolius riggenbachi]|uniref:mucin-4 n=1 Tax=Hyperolius riggenbachi TaxID=752182 RepID=UPI0035A2BFE6
MTSSSSPVTVSSTSKSTSITTTQTTTSLSAKPTTTTANSTTTSVTATSTTTTVPTTAGTPAAVLFGYGPNFGDTTYVQRRTDFTSPLFQPLMGFPFGNQIRNFIYYTDNGQIVFPSSRNNIFSYTNPPDNGFSGSCSLSSIAVFWNDADFSKNVGTTYYQVYTGTSNNDPVVTRAQDLITKYMKSNYTAQWTLKITWENAPAYPAKGNDSKTNTYQALLTTDGSRSYVLMLYKDGSMNWDVTHPNPLMGFCSDGTDQFFWNDNMALNKYRPDNFVGSNSDLRGLWIYSLNSTILDNSRMNCLNWYNAQPDPSTWNANLLSCPCLYTQGLSDLRYRVTKAGQSTIISLLRSTSPNSYNAGVRCVYYRKKQFLEGFQERTWQFASSKSDSELAAYDLCCNQVENPQFCSMYKQMRPPISCRTYRPLLPAWMFGDPHITTLDGLGYTFNGLGDYILITASGLTTSFILQGRTVQTGVAQATNFNAFAAQYTFSTGNVTVEWYLENDGNISTLLNGQNVTFSYSADMDSLINNSNSAVFLLKNGSISATFGGILTVTVSEYAGMLSAVSSLPEQFYNNTKGLLGTWNNDQSDDFLMPNGTTIPSTSSEEAIYSYGLLWEVGGNNLFTFLQTTQTSTFKPVFLSTLSSLDPAKYVQLQTLCGNNSECIFDGMSTNNTALALATLNVVTTLQVTNTTLNAIPPYITAGNTSVQTFMNSSVTLQYTSNGTGVTFSADPGTNLDITVSGNGSLTWTPTSTTGFSFNLVATDSKNLSSTLQISFVVCNCVLSSECDYNSTTLIQNSSLATAACICTNNYTGDLCQYSPNLCFQDCFPGVSCDNTTGCGACPTGYSGNGLHCADIDECTTSNPCSLNALCTNTVGSYNCTCNSGFDGNGTYCADINECHTSGICPANAACSNTIGSYNCSCNAGFQGNGTSCVEIDECQINGTCSSHATCNNTIGSYICTCISGFTGNGTYCADINECQTSGICSPYATCTNTDGSYTCSCNAGLIGNGTYCADINECQTSGICSPNAACSNTIGSYTCTCNAGFQGNGTYCGDINECLINGTCSPYANCSNTIGNYSCTCNTGFTGNGTWCTDINECQNNTMCSPNATCSNTLGSYKCVCNTGFTGNGTSCFDIDECQINGTCSSHATCSNTIGSYICTCISGFTGNGTYCADINECQTSGICSPYATCTNTDGSYTCSCNAGLIGNGKVCSCSDCDLNYCSNGGTCQKSPPSCNPQCLCPPAYKDAKCVISGNNFQAALRADTPKRSMYFNFTSSGTFNSTDARSKVVDILTYAPINVVYLLFNNGSSDMGDLQAKTSVYFANFTAQFTYEANTTMITFLNDQLLSYITKNLSISTRAAADLRISNVASGQFLTKDQLLAYAACNVTGYTMNPNTLQCVSLCESYCSNDGVCSQIGYNVTCTCKPFSMYVTSGDRCDTLSMNLNAFFGILFGALAFLLLLILGVGLGIYYYRKKRKQNLYEDTDELYQTKFSWKSSGLPSFGKLRNKNFEEADTTPQLVEWKPHLERINTLAEVKIKRPDVKPESDTAKTNDYE